MSWKWTASFSIGTTAITARSIGTTVPEHDRMNRETYLDHVQGTNNKFSGKKKNKKKKAQSLTFIPNVSQELTFFSLSNSYLKRCSKRIENILVYYQNEINSPLRMQRLNFKYKKNSSNSLPGVSTPIVSPREISKQPISYSSLATYAILREGLVLPQGIQQHMIHTYDSSMQSKQ